MSTTSASVYAMFLALAAAAPAALAGGVPEAPLDVRKTVEAKFVKAPAASKDGANVKIAFESSAATDAEVAVLDAKGKAVRHLAAGLLGKNAPEPFRKDALAQELVWDGRDDTGKAATGGPFKVRVRLGSQARLEKYLCPAPMSFAGQVMTVTVGAGGELFVLVGEPGKFGRAEMLVLDKTGKYLRTIMPYPADTPKERTESVGQLTVDGRRVPILYSGHSFSVYPLTCGLRAQTMAWHPKGYLIAASSPGTAREHGVPRYLVAIHPKGGAPEGVSFVGPKIREPKDFLGGGGERAAAGLDRLATSLDGEYVYFVQRIASNQFKGDWKHGVFRVKWGEEAPKGLWLGKNAPGAGDEEFSDPQGIAVDKDGRLFVCDRGNDRVKVYSPEGKLLGKFAAESPEQIAVHPETGTVFVMSCAAPKLGEYSGGAVVNGVLRAFSAWKDGKSAPLGEFTAAGLSCIALDREASPPRIWTVTRTREDGQSLVPLTFAGGKFEAGEAVKSGKCLKNPSFIAADPERSRLFVKEHLAGGKGAFRTVNLETGEVSASGIKGADIALDRHGNIYVMDGYGKNSLSRYDPAGKPLPFAGTGSNKIEVKYRAFGPDMGMRGHRVAPNGDIYVIHSFEHGVGAPLDVFGPDGKLKKSDLVAGLGGADSGLGVDAAGNVYVGANVRSKEKPFPEEFAGQVPAENWVWWARGRERNKQPAPWSYIYCNPYLWHMGALFKFGPEGGGFYGQQGSRKSEIASPGTELEKAPADATAYKTACYAGDVKVSGAKWRYGGVGGVPASLDGPRPDPGCSCMPSHLDTDLWGRSYTPNTFLFGVDVVDSAGNRLARIGRYDNIDNAGPEITFAGPEACDFAEADGKLYVSDISSRRVAVIGFDWSSSAECAAP